MWQRATRIGAKYNELFLALMHLEALQQHRCILLVVKNRVAHIRSKKTRIEFVRGTFDLGESKSGLGLVHSRCSFSRKSTFAPTTSSETKLCVIYSECAIRNLRDETLRYILRMCDQKLIALRNVETTFENRWWLLPAEAVYMPLRYKQIDFRNKISETDR